MDKLSSKYVGLALSMCMDEIVFNFVLLVEEFISPKRCAPKTSTVTKLIVLFS